jgi:glycosyltransferase involved in cell wall biosynthesis
MGSRIALVSREFPPRSGGGIGAYAASIAPALARAGSTVHVITRSLASGETEPQHPAGVRVHRLNMGDRSGESCLRSSLVVARKLLDIARADGLDAIEFAEYEAMASAWLALRSLDEQAARIAVAVHLHSPTELNAELNGHDPAHLDRAMRTLIEAERRCIALADGVCAPGSFMADWATRRFAMPARPVVIPYAAAPGTLAEPTESSRVLLYVGRLERRKGVDTLIQAWNRIAPEHPDWVMRLVGDDTNTAPGGGSCRAWLDTLLAPELAGRTEFAGPMDADELHAARRAGAIAVIPSRWENFPNTCIEAMAAGLPVVASDHGGMAEMLGLPAISGSADGESGSVFPAGDDALLAQSLGRWMSMGSEARIAAGTAARDRINTLCDARTVAQRRIQWLGSLAATPGAIDPTLADLLQVGAVHPGGSLDTVLARTLDRYDRTTGAVARAGDPAQWIERVRAALADLGARGLSPVALYGAGHFARSIGPALDNPPAEVACIIDDNPQSHGHTLHALPIVSQTEAMRRGVRAVVLCANQWEDKLWAASEPVRSAGIEVVRLFSRRPVRVMVVESGSDTRHFAGVARELERRGIEVVGDLSHAVYPVPDDDLDLVCVADVLAPRNIAIARSARAKGIRTLLMMDGIVEWRNTFINPLAGPDFLRPAPVDFICCATTDDERHLVELGNTACATGLPRLDGLAQATLDPCGPVLVATANTPSFNDDERARLLEALARLKQHADSAGIRVRWRLTGGLERAIGVHNHPGLLVEAMSGCRGLISTPSTLLLEGELAGLPIAVLDPFGQSAFDGLAGVARGDDPVALFASLRQPGRWVQRVYPPARSGETAASRVADRIAEIARSPGRTQARAPFLNTVRLPAEIPRTDRPRAVSVIVCDGSPTSGVTTFSLRMSEQSAARNSGWEWHTLLVQTQPRNAANDGLRELRPERLEHVHVCVLDPTADHHETLRACRDAIELLHPDVLAPNFSDMTWAVAAQLRYRGIRTLGIMHSDDDAYRALLADRPVWDAGVAVSAECTDQMRSIASERFDEPPPVEQITYGVPVAETLPRRSCTGPMRLLYVGRLIEHQKRVSRLIELAMHLRELGCAFTLDLIGDGPSESGLRSAIEAEGLGDLVRLRGRLTPEQVQAELDTADGLVLVSDFEGTSIAMLEAMGRGVIPCVSEVASGVSEWVRDGENGVSAAVGDVRGLAEKIASLAVDREHLRSLQHAAWSTVRLRSSISAMFDRYQAALEATMRRDLDPAPSDYGLRLIDATRWKKPRADDPAAAEAYAFEILREAGFIRVRRGTPALGDHGAVVDPVRDSVEASTIEAWRASGVGVACVPLLVLRPQLQALRRTLDRALAGGASRLALYGAGLHTQRHLTFLESVAEIRAVIDDSRAGSSMGRFDVVSAHEAIEVHGCDAVILSSDTIEDGLWNASAGLRDAGVPVYRVYSAEPSSASRKDASIAATT